MISAKAIQATCDDIVREFAPLQVILFGSYAYGAPTEDSDVDLLVVMDILKSETWQRRCEIKARIPKRFPLDLQVRSAADIAYRFSHNDWFLHEVLEKGDVLYETEGALPPLKLAEDALVPVWQQKRRYQSVDTGKGADSRIRLGRSQAAPTAIDTPTLRLSLFPCAAVY